MMLPTKTPMTSPFSLITGPPLLPGEMGVVICMCSKPKTVRRELMIPSETVPDSPWGDPMEMIF